MACPDIFTPFVNCNSDYLCVQLPHQLPGGFGPVAAADDGADGGAVDPVVPVVDAPGPVASVVVAAESSDSTATEAMEVAEPEGDVDEAMDVDDVSVPPEAPIDVGPVSVLWFRTQTSRYARMDPHNCPDYWAIADRFVGMWYD